MGMAPQHRKLSLRTQCSSSAERSFPKRTIYFLPILSPASSRRTSQQNARIAARGVVRLQFVEFNMMILLSVASVGLLAAKLVAAGVAALVLGLVLVAGYVAVFGRGADHSSNLYKSIATFCSSCTRCGVINCRPHWLCWL